MIGAMNLDTMKVKKFGIRIENLIYVKKNKNKIFFKNLTLHQLILT